MEEKEVCSQISFSTPGGLICYRYRIGVMRKRDRLVKGKNIHIFSGNMELPGAWMFFFHYPHGLVFLVIVARRCFQT